MSIVIEIAWKNISFNNGPNKLVEEFVDCFLHLCYEIPKILLNFDFLREEFKHMPHISQYIEPQPLNLFVSLTFANHEVP